MNFLEYGMKNEKSKSLIQRTIAKGILAFEKKWADVSEARLNRKYASDPGSPEEDAALFEKIQNAIQNQDQE